MKFWKRRWVRIGLIILIILAAVQMGTYWAFGERTMPTAALRIGLNETQFGYVVIDADAWATLSPAQRAELEGMLHRHTSVIYHDMGEVPVESMSVETLTPQGRASIEEFISRPNVSPKTREVFRAALERGYRVHGLKNGISISWQPAGFGLFWMRCSANSWVGMLGAEGRDDLYIWVLGRWVRVWNYLHVLS